MLELEELTDEEAGKSFQKKWVDIFDGPECAGQWWHDLFLAGFGREFAS